MSQRSAYADPAVRTHLCCAGERIDAAAKMTIRFPNPSRHYDATRDAVRFWGYNQSIETSFSISIEALQQLAPGTPRREDALLAVFDRNRARICEAATRVYGNGRRGASYDLTAANF